MTLTAPSPALTSTPSPPPAAGLLAQFRAVRALTERLAVTELFTGDSLPQAQRRRRGLGIEPMTAPPNAI